MKSKLLPVLTFAKIDIRRLFRDKVGIFFVFIFPLIFLLVFGSIFGGNSDVSFNVALMDNSGSQFSETFKEQLKKVEVLKIDESIDNVDEAKEQMVKGTIDAIITMPETFGYIQPGTNYPSGQLEVLYDRGSEQAGATLGSILESMITSINDELVPTVEPFTVKTAATEVEGLTNLDYIFSGLLGFTILSMGVFGPTSVFPRMKEKGILRRYHMTPVRVWQYFAGNVISNSVIGLMSVAVMFAVAVALFGVSMRGDFLSLTLLVVLGIITLFGVGLAAGGWAKNENQAAPLGNLISFPMMFLSGVFFPRFLMPEWLQGISAFFPLTPLIDGIRMVIIEGKSILELGPEVALLAGWVVVIYFIAFKVFRWE